MASSVYYSPFIPAFSPQGLPVPGAKLYFYYTGTTNPAPIYTDAGLTIAAANPVVADLAARFNPVYLDNSITYRVRMTTSTGAPIGSDIDNYIPGTALKGDPGPASNTRVNLTAFKAASITDLSSIWDGSLWLWTFGNFTGQADDINIVKANSTDLSVGAWLRQSSKGITFTQGGSGAVLRSVQDKLRESVSVKDFGAKGDGITDDTLAIQKAMDFANTNKIGEVFIPAGDYKTTAPLNVPLLVALRGPATPFPQAAYNPTTVNAGAVIYKAHGGNAIVKAGNPANGIYQQAAGFYNIGIRSNYNTWATGDGFFVDYVGGFEMMNCAAYSIGGNAFRIGYTAADVTGNIYLQNLYANNPSNGAAYAIRARWVTGMMLVSDGGQQGMDLYNCSDCAFYECHHEAPQVAGLRLSGTMVNNLFQHHWVLCNYATNPQAPAVLGFFVDPGSALNRFVSCRFIGNDVAGNTAVKLTTNLVQTSVFDCSFDGFPIGVDAVGSMTRVERCQFYTINLPVRVAADKVEIKDNVTDATPGSWSIDHVSGNGGDWSGNLLDKPIKATATSTAGNFGTNRVSNNRGYKTRSFKVTGAVASGFTFAHGLAAAPTTSFATTVSPFALPADFKLSADATNWSATWSGGGNLQLSLMGALFCEEP